jgi:thymidylate kinase
VKLLVVEHQHGAGGTHHVTALVAALCARGIHARAFHHAPPPMDRPRDPWSVALHYAAERAAWWQAVQEGHEEADVVVTDRWLESSKAIGLSLSPFDVTGEAMLAFARAEQRVLPTPALVVVLDASDDVLDRRIEARGLAVTEDDTRCRETYRDPAIARSWGAVRVDTDRPVEVVEAEILTRALRALGVG